MARRATTQVLESMYLMNTTHVIFRESMRVILVNPTQFHSISIFLFSPFPISLFLSHFLIHHFPQIPSSPIFNFTQDLLGHSLPKLLSKSIVHIIICFPSAITFSLLGRAATVQAVSDSYNGICLDGRRILIKSGLVWFKLLHTSFWELLVVFGLVAAFVANIVVMSKVLGLFGFCSEALRFWGVLGFSGLPFCVVFAHVTVVGNLARVLAVLEGDCHGFEALFKAKNLMEGRRQTALIMALLSNVGFRLVECLFEFRMCKGMNLWEVPLLVSMYSLVLVFDTVMNVVFYYACKCFDD